MFGKKSNVWRFFTKISNVEYSCKICGNVYKSSGNTTNIRTHLRYKHPRAFEASCSTAPQPPVSDQGSPTSEIEVKPDLPKYTVSVGDTSHASEEEEYCSVEAPRKKKKVVRELFLQQVLDKILPPKMYDDDYFGAYVSAQLLTFPPLESDKLKMEIHTLIYNRRLELERSEGNLDSLSQPSPSTSPPQQAVELASSLPQPPNASLPKSLATTISKPTKCISNMYQEHPSTIGKTSSTQSINVASPSQPSKFPSITPRSSLSKFLKLSPNQSSSHTSLKHNSVQSNSS